MTLDELAHTLPNGFDDCYIKHIAIDYVAQRVTLEVAVSLHRVDHKPEDGPEKRDGVILLEGVEFFAIEPPRESYQAKHGLPLATDSRIEDCSPELVPEAARVPPPGCFAGAFFVFDWNAFIFFVAKDARLEWKDE